MTQPDIYIGFTPSLNAGHGNHQQAGRYIWEGVKAAADPNMFPEQLTGPNALSTWQVKKVFSGGSHRRHRRHDDRRRLHHRLHPRRDQHGHGRGRLDRLRLAVPVAGRQRPGPARGHAEDLGAGRLRGRARLPDAEPRDVQGAASAGLLALRHDGLLRAVPAQRERRTARPTPPPARTTRSSTARPSPTRAGCRSGTLEYLTFSRFFNTPGTPFEATLQPEAPAAGTLAAGNVGADAARRAGPSTRRRSRSARSPTARRTRCTFTVTPPADAAVDAMYKIAARYTAGAATGYTDDTVRLVSPAEGRFQRWGKWAEYDNWLEQHGARGAPRSAARPRSARSSMGETIDFPVNVHNWSDDAAERHGQPDAAGELHAPTRPRSRTGRSRRARDDDGHVLRSRTHRRDAADDDPGRRQIGERHRRRRRTRRRGAGHRGR